MIQEPLPSDLWMIQWPLPNDLRIIQKPFSSDSWMTQEPLSSDSWMIAKTLPSDSWMIQGSLPNDSWIIHESLSSNFWMIQKPLPSDTRVIRGPLASDSLSLCIVWCSIVCCPVSDELRWRLRGRAYAGLRSWDRRRDTTGGQRHRQQPTDGHCCLRIRRITKDRPADSDGRSDIVVRVGMTDHWVAIYNIKNQQHCDNHDAVKWRDVNTTWRIFHRIFLCIDSTEYDIISIPAELGI